MCCLLLSSLSLFFFLELMPTINILIIIGITNKTTEKLYSCALQKIMNKKNKTKKNKGRGYTDGANVYSMEYQNLDRWVVPSV